MSKKVIILIVIFVSLVGGLYLFTKEQGKWFWTTVSILGKTLFPSGEASKEEVVATYLEGLTQRNTTKISRIVHPNLKADKEIRVKIDELGGNEFKNINVTYEKPEPEFTPFPLKAHITGKMITPKGTELPFDEVLEIAIWGGDGKFYLVMGEARYPMPEDAVICEDAPTSTLDIEQNMKEHPE